MCFKQIVELALCFELQHETLLTFRLNRRPQGSLKKQEAAGDEWRSMVSQVQFFFTLMRIVLINIYIQHIFYFLFFL